MTTEEIELVTPPPPPPELLDAHEYLIYGYVLDDDFHFGLTVLFPNEADDPDGGGGCNVMYGVLEECGLTHHIMVNWGRSFVNPRSAAILAVAHKERGVVTLPDGKGKVGGFREKAEHPGQAIMVEYNGDYSGITRIITKAQCPDKYTAHIWPIEAWRRAFSRYTIVT